MTSVLSAINFTSKSGHVRIKNWREFSPTAVPTLRTPEVMGKQNPNDFILVFPGSQKNKAIVSTLTVPKSSHSEVTCCSLSWFCACSASLPPHFSPLEAQPVTVCIPPHEGFVPSDTANGIQSMHLRIKEKDGFGQRPHVEKVWNVHENLLMKKWRAFLSVAQLTVH